MSDFILPEDIHQMATQSAQHIADAWYMLTEICVAKQYPFDVAKVFVDRSVLNGMSEIEALHIAYKAVAEQ